MNAHKRHLVGTTRRELRYDPLDKAPYMLVTTWGISDEFMGSVVERTVQHWLTKDEVEAYLLETQMAEDISNDFYNDRKYWYETR